MEAIIFLFLGLTCVISVSGSVSTVHTADEIWKESSDILHVEQRHRRDVMDYLKSEFEWFVQNRETFCFCGKKNWLHNLVRIDTTESLKCIRQSKVNFTENEAFFSRFAKIVNASQCVYNCVFKGYNLLTLDGSLNKTAVTELFKDKIFVEEGQQETANKVLDRCLSTGTGNPSVSSFLLNFAIDSDCKNNAYKFIICLLTEFVEECPETLRRNDEPRCTQMYRNMEISRRGAGK